MLLKQCFLRLSPLNRHYKLAHMPLYRPNPQLYE
mgnify:CR=1 FL=1